MVSGPLFRHEYHAATRNRRPFVFRTLIGAVLGGVAMAAAMVAVSGPGPNAGFESLLIGRVVFCATVAAEVVVLAFLVPALIGGAIAEEREKDTLPSLLLTRLSPFEILLTKMVARWLSTMNLVLIGVPIIVAAAWAAGLEVEMALALLGLASSAGFMACLAILASASRQQAANARAESGGWIFGWLIAPPVLSIIPAAPTTLLGMLFADLKWLCGLVAPSSPLSLVTDNRWFINPASSSLEARIAVMVGLQAAFGLFVLGLATTKLKARETNPNWLDPTRGYRPPCGDDPIFWREYELPMRRGSGPLIGLRLRSVVIIIKVILINLLALVAMLIALAIPVGIVAATFYYGYEAFAEARETGYGPGRPFVKRATFSLLVRGATCLLGLMPLANISALISGRIVNERDKKTWDLLMSTPLSGAEILRAKTMATLYALRHSILPFLPVIWAVGVAVGAVWPPGIVLAAVDLVLAAWAFWALGLYATLRPRGDGPAPPQVALASLAMAVLHMGFLAVVLATPIELAWFASLEVGVRVAVSLVVSSIPILTGLAAWYYSRITLDQFDEWVGRPIRGTRPEDRRAGAQAQTPVGLPPTAEATAQ